MKEQEITWRPVGFREVFDLLDLDRYDEIILADLKRTDEKLSTGIIELFQKDRAEKPSPQPPIRICGQDLEESISPISSKPNTGKSLGKIRVETAMDKLL